MTHARTRRPGSRTPSTPIAPRRTPKRTATSTSARSRRSGVRILARLEQAGHRARVLPFPGAGTGVRLGTSHPRRWISAAAAAGLFIGLVTGQLLHVMPGDNWVHRDRSGVASPAGRRAWRSCPRSSPPRSIRKTRCSTRSTPPSPPRRVGPSRVRRPHPSASRTVVPALIFRKGLDLKHEVAGVLAASYHSPLVDQIKEARLPLPVGPPHRAPGTGVRVLLRRRSRGRLRLPGPQALSQPAGLPDRRDHPQPARQRPAAPPGHPLPERSRTSGDRARPGRCRHPARVRGDDRRAAAARCDRLHAGRHDLRIGAERLEERQALRAGRVHLGDPRQVLARGDPGHRLAGRARPAAATTSSCSIGRGAEYVCGYITRRRRSPTAFRARFRDAVSPGFDPDRHLARVGCANQTTMLSTESLAIGEMFRDAMRERYGEAELPQRFRAFDTICSATQDRQDAVIAAARRAARST